MVPHVPLVLKRAGKLMFCGARYDGDGGPRVMSIPPRQRAESSVPTDLDAIDVFLPVPGLQPKSVSIVRGVSGFRPGSLFPQWRF